MPRNGSGTYSLPAGTIVSNGQTLDQSQHNPAMQDIAAEFNAARPIVAGGTGATTASGARAALGLAIGSDVQAYDATLASIAALGTAADRIAVTTGVDTWAETVLTAAGRALIDDADATAQRATLGLGAAATAGFLDEDNFASDSATAAPSQQSTKAYINTAIPAKLNASGTAPVYACRAWVCFNGYTAAIRASGNVSHVTRGSAGDWWVTFTTAMPHANYAVIGMSREESGQGGRSVMVSEIDPPLTTSVRIINRQGNVTVNSDSDYIFVAIFC